VFERDLELFLSLGCVLITFSLSAPFLPVIDYLVRITPGDCFLFELFFFGQFNNEFALLAVNFRVELKD
jgi:hypothetical protein